MENLIIIFLAALAIIFWLFMTDLGNKVFMAICLILMAGAASLPVYFFLKFHEVI